MEAVESSESRKYLLRKSLEYTFKFPVFGVGPGQFASYEGKNNMVIGTHGAWHETHNTFTQVACECGIPGFLLFVTGILSSFRLLRATYRSARRRPECQDIATAAFYITLGMGGYCVAILFLSHAYTFYLPCIGGLAVAVHAAAQEEFRLRAPGNAA
jgi:O-antigen ligase